ncbi:MerR family regulatory protein [Candidatus Kryptobacter tengchongensis]|uniref:MerR family regulatory protein n=2 Tax=Candidatus Kryptoniota TaxID=1855361 RepID=A0A656D3S3_KRYT1|nr:MULTISPECIES: MerR family DNA-binding transcriptional regulator [Candidatus Kryptonia]CUS96736.1 MerR family regulatory protein [Candidatus Kryptobacter tengchongensis]CUS98970.1 MerR family regulatory protein [Candidatus Kryptobacter tengchongensis]CUT03496.1 MerR family regulatory protein [Candidatus Chrysopegis kryptomonas]CUU05238.1 MerR family regulatory protein [Candidatus Kryptobacter tengchongensis]
MIYYIKDLALRLGVSRVTIINWEKRGFLKKPKRDKNNRRIYTDDDIREILSLVRETDYFKNLKKYRRNKKSNQTG